MSDTKELGREDFFGHPATCWSLGSALHCQVDVVFEFPGSASGTACGQSYQLFLLLKSSLTGKSGPSPRRGVTPPF